MKTPKPVSQTAGTEKKVQVLRNPYLDGVDPLIRARQTGVGSLRIDRTAPSGSLKVTRSTANASPAVTSLAINRTA